MMPSAQFMVSLPSDRRPEIERKAASMGITADEFVRRAIDDYEQISPEEEAELALLVEQANEAIPAMAASLDRMIANVQATREEIRRTLASLSTHA